MAEIINVGFKRLSDNAIIPKKAHASDSGFDLVASEDVVIEPGDTAVVPTGIAVQLPDGYEGQVRPRSGVTAKTKIRVNLGTIDNGYNGNIGVIVDNINQTENESIEVTDLLTGRKESKIRKKTSLNYETLAGDYIDVGIYRAQMAHEGEELMLKTLKNRVLCCKGTYLIRKGDRIAQLVVQALPSVESVEIETLEVTRRGAKGYGSSGVRKEHIRGIIEDNREVLQRLEGD